MNKVLALKLLRVAEIIFNTKNIMLLNSPYIYDYKSGKQNDKAGCLMHEE